jgi:phosphoglycerate dehydrogenase-like enzyme
VIVTSTRGIHGAPLSEIAILHMLSMARNFPRSVRSHDRHHWDRFRSKTLQGRRVGILGVGLIAEALAPRVKALGMTVVGISRTARPLPGFDEWRSRDDLAKAVADLDFLVLLIPLEDSTRHIIDAHILGAMKKGAFIVNIARGGVIDEVALAEALTSGHLGGAALDTVHQEPLPAEDPLWSAPNLIITPHLGGFYDTYPEDSMEQISFNIRAFLEGRFADMIHQEAR